MSFTDYDVALGARDVIQDLARKAVDKVRPDYVYGVVTAIGSGLSYAMVMLPGDLAATKVLVGSRAPTYVGQVVRVKGNAGDKHIDDVIGDAYNTVTGTVVVGAHRGIWSSGTTYGQYEMASYNGRTWASKNAGNLNHTPLEGTYWTLVADQGATGATGAQGAQGIPGPGLVLRGVYDAATTYNMRDVVSYNGGSFTSRQNSNTANTPAESPYWQTNGAQGTQGTQGIQGIPGSTGSTGSTGPAGPPGSVDRGIWSSATTYAIRDSVGFNGKWWGSLQDGNLNHSPVEGAWWTLRSDKGDQGIQGDPGVGLIPRGVWYIGTTYAYRDLVSDGAGSTWVSKHDGNVGHQPAEDSHWTIVSYPGAAGNSTAYRSSAIGDGSTLTFTIIHNIGRIPSSWSVLDVLASPKKFVIPREFTLDPTAEANKVIVTFGYPPKTGQYIVGVVA